VIRRKGPWRHLESVEFATLNWVDWFNMRRLDYAQASPGGARRHPDPNTELDATADERLQDVLRPLVNDGVQSQLDA
jgi:hypothetical protein